MHISLFVKFLSEITRKVGRKKGLHRIIEIIRKHYSRLNYIAVINDFDGDLFFTINTNEHMGSQIFWYGNYSYGLLNKLDELLKPGMVFIDVGANHGEFSCFAAKRCSQVIAFEPVTELYNRLLCNITLNRLNNVQPINSAAGEKDEFLPIYTQKTKFDDGTENAGLSTLHASGVRTEFINNIEVVRLDEQLASIPKIDLMKIDVEGHEFSVIKGAESIIKRDKPFILIEINDEMLRAAGTTAKALFNHIISIGYSAETIDFKGNTHKINENELTEFQDVLFSPT